MIQLHVLVLLGLCYIKILLIDTYDQSLLKTYSWVQGFLPITRIS